MMILNKTLPKKRLSSKWMLRPACRQRVHRRCAPAPRAPERAKFWHACQLQVDSKNEPHRKKKSSFFFQCGRSITRKARGANQSHNAMRGGAFFSASVCASQPIYAEPQHKLLFKVERGRGWFFSSILDLSIYVCMYLCIVWKIQIFRKCRNFVSRSHE